MQGMSSSTTLFTSSSGSFKLGALLLPFLHACNRRKMTKGKSCSYMHLNDPHGKRMWRTRVFGEISLRFYSSCSLLYRIVQMFQIMLTKCLEHSEKVLWKH